MSADKKCPNCGACKECGSRPQIAPNPYPVYPWPYQVQPFPARPQPFGPYRPYPYATWQASASGNSIKSTWTNTANGNYQ